MYIYFALIIPIIIGLLGFIIYHHKITWWEGLLPTLVVFIFIFGFKACVQKVQTDDTEYRGASIVRAEYYEPYETWVIKTCTRTYKCGKSTCTQTYNCSYCSHHSAEFIVYDKYNHSWHVSRQKYQELLNKWKCTPKFVELGRSIHYHNGCGQDGDMYYITWGGDVANAESAVITHTYENRLQAAHTAFHLKEISHSEAAKKSLYKYPKIFDEYRQINILGLDSLGYSTQANTQIYQWYEYLNAYWGHKAHVKIFVLLFYDKPQSIAHDQESYWDGGNDNEFVICIGMNKKTRVLDWVKCFSWSKNKRISVDIREEIMDQKVFQPYKVWGVINRNIGTFKPRDFTEFNYLTVEPPFWAVITTYIIALIISVFVIGWGYTNDIESSIFTKNHWFDKK